MTKVVLDSSVLSAFAKIGRIRLLGKILSKSDVYIPDRVYYETANTEIDKVIAPTPEEKSKTRWIRVEKTGSNGGLGEQGVLELALKLDAVAVLDDKNARQQAEKHKIRYTGTLALLKRSRERGLISKKELSKILKDLEEKDNFRMTEELKKWTLN